MKTPQNKATTRGGTSIRRSVVAISLFVVGALCIGIVTIVRVLPLLAGDGYSNHHNNSFFLDIEFRINSPTLRQEQEGYDDSKNNKNHVVVRVQQEPQPTNLQNKADDDTTSTTTTTTTTSTTNTSTSTKKPYLYIHMGPHKTGSTTIQRFAKEHVREFEKDGFKKRVLGYRIGDDAWKDIVSCLSRPSPKCKDWNTNVNETFDDLSKNMFLSNEILANVAIEKSARWKKLITFLQSHYHVHVILVYRRYHEWILSMYNQHYKYEGAFGKQMNLWPSTMSSSASSSSNSTSSTTSTKNNLTTTSSSTATTSTTKSSKKGDGRAIPPFPIYWDQTINGKIDGDKYNLRNRWDYTNNLPIHDCLQLKRKLVDQNISVIVLNMHHSSSTTTSTTSSTGGGGKRGGSSSSSSLLLPDLFCDTIVPHMKYTCEAAKQATDKRSNQGVNHFDVDMIGVAAYQQGLIKKVGVERRAVMKGISEYLRSTNQTTTGLPLVCLTKDKEDLLRDISYQAEKELMPSMLSTFNESFHKAITNHKFCNVDTNRLLQDPTWRMALQTIEYD